MYIELESEEDYTDVNYVDYSKALQFFIFRQENTHFLLNDNK